MPDSTIPEGVTLTRVKPGKKVSHGRRGPDLRAEHEGMSMGLDLAAVEDALGRPLEDFSRQCHAASLALVQSGLLGPGARVARGTLRGIGGQHSWAVVGDPYAPSRIVDITAWSWGVEREGEPVPRVWEPSLTDPRLDIHSPHGAGLIWSWGSPSCGDGEGVPLEVEVSESARNFLALIAQVSGRADLDIVGWCGLMSAPVDGWPAAEIIAAMADTPRLSAFVPVDRLGMLTDRNPGGFYF